VGYHYKYEKFEDTVRRINKLYSGWPVFAETEAGQQFLRLVQSQNRPSGGLKKMLKPLKAWAMPLLKPLCDTHMPLPGWLYGMVFYHYVMPFSSVVSQIGGEE